MKKYILLIIGLIIVISGLLYLNHRFNRENTPIVTASTITSPRGGETFVQGQTYTLTWTGGIDPTNIFLIDMSLKDEGASVSISDRIYGIQNNHTYEYTVPADMKPGEYQFQIGDVTSEPFEVVAD